MGVWALPPSLNASLHLKTPDTVLRYQKDTDHIATVTLDMDDRPYNIFNHSTASAFKPLIQYLMEEKRKGLLRGVIITSSKKNFATGADIEHLFESDNQQVAAYAANLQEVLRDLEKPGVPVVAAINGSALGPGFGLALACHHRIALSKPDLRLGLPEIGLGLIPGGGSIVRLLWLLGLEKAWEVLTSGWRYRPREALQLGLVDDLADSTTEMLDKAKSWLLQHPEGRRAWDVPINASKEGAPDPRRSLDRKQVQALTTRDFALSRGNDPAHQAILTVLAEAMFLPFDEALKVEARQLLKVLRTPSARNRTQAFWYDQMMVKEGQLRPKGYGKFRPRQVGVIGTGTMGTGISVACLLHGMEVVIKDVSLPIAEQGKLAIVHRLRESVNTGRLSREEYDQILQRIHITDNAEAFRTCDLVLEAVFENLPLKIKVLRESEMVLDEFSIFASNTVSIPITELSKHAIRPANYIGLHFFLPADEVPLVEVVRGAHTSEETIARAFDFVVAIGKIPILVRDDWGFYVSRVQNTYILEGVALLQEGVSPALIENLALQSGMPRGPLALADDLGLDLVLRYEQQAAANYGSKYLQHPAVNALVWMQESQGRNGNKQGAGFYDYMASSPNLWSGLIEQFQKPHELRHGEIMERLLFAQVLEALWCLTEKVVQSVPEANLGSIYGWGFPANTGGVIQYVRSYGLEAFQQHCHVLEQAHGPRFKFPTQATHFIETDAIIGKPLTRMM